MKVNAIWNRPDERQDLVKFGNTGCPKTVTTTKIIRHRDEQLRLRIVKPLLLRPTDLPFPAFLFIPSGLSGDDYPAQEIIASELVKASGQAAIMISNLVSKAEHSAVFQLFAAMKWVGIHGPEIGINGNRIALVGTHLGANIASVLSLMALNDPCPTVSLQILVDPHFFISEKQLSGRPFRRPGYSDIPGDDQDWVNMKGIYNMPFELKINELFGLPPTLIQLSKNAGNHCEVDYYYTRLLHAGTDVTYINYEEPTSDNPDRTTPYLSESLLIHAAAELQRLA